jgi:hypothetical protein
MTCIKKHAAAWLGALLLALVQLVLPAFLETLDEVNNDEQAVSDRERAARAAAGSQALR